MTNYNFFGSKIAKGEILAQKEQTEFGEAW